ncbi:hypothetical protein A2774_04515 [Candidatus Roizmanbacteria bacterium RIFCSPHIGHO2_01_FULL_39_12c]|uniref:Glycoside hydrolase family 42 N-terminal domain-containing protein n=1 Tax=Candidatus Roizmanbacteria bacterium RIFCSPHIGHO2_01_FULL_39_12c TaxID=1802031 RepID=A0A1F7G9V2_9BACT|nr:MAG: hypothetical protein A2774_04515 [Candidatus Roizmanbacteria bacterium RIFCSPHIGHO2_01_FULL_39_12c]OGK47771.1 MAG: hypothetical protein A2963_02855 [Candidatus Roizmanbacteria bacterium RIFCSPLOWO2_01_FULL_40_13]
MLKKLVITISLFLIFTSPVHSRERFFQVQSVDTMKYSRDLAREKLKDNTFNQEIETQVKNIAATGATHVSLGTPYEDEFLPYLKRWVTAARKYKLKVWFRGNLAGWEEWFDYPRIDRSTHIGKIQNFILSNPDLFEDGDVFTSCPECENGGPGDPRKTRDIEGFRNFIAAEYKAVKEGFDQTGKKVKANFYSMNGDVARLIMDRETTEKLDGAVTIDHYVSTPEKLENDIVELAEQSGGKIVLGEFGAPIPDIHGDLSEEQQASWIDEALDRTIKTGKVIAVNYWTYNASSTRLWENDNSPRLAASALEKYYNPVNVYGRIIDSKGNLIKDVNLKMTDIGFLVKNGIYAIPIINEESLTFSKKGFVSVNFPVRAAKEKDIKRDVVLSVSSENPIYNWWRRVVDFLNTTNKQIRQIIQINPANK